MPTREQSLLNHLDVVLGVQGESVVDALRQDDHLVLFTAHPDPLLVLAPYSKVSCKHQGSGPQLQDRAMKCRIQAKY